MALQADGSHLLPFDLHGEDHKQQLCVFIPCFVALSTFVRTGIDQGYWLDKKSACAHRSICAAKKRKGSWSKFWYKI